MAIVRRERPHISRPGKKRVARAAITSRQLRLRLR